MYILVMGDENGSEEKVFSSTTKEHAIKMHMQICSRFKDYFKWPAYILDCDDNIVGVYPGEKEEKLIYAASKMLLKPGEWL